METTHRENLQALLHALEDVPSRLFTLDRVEHERLVGRRSDLANLMLHTPYFRERGVVDVDGRGAPLMYDRSGALTDAAETAATLFGAFDHHDPIETLFMPPGCGVWDESLISASTRPLSHKGLALARLRRALGVGGSSWFDAAAPALCWRAPAGVRTAAWPASR